MSLFSVAIIARGKETAARPQKAPAARATAKTRWFSDGTTRKKSRSSLRFRFRPRCRNSRKSLPTFIDVCFEGTWEPPQKQTGVLLLFELEGKRVHAITEAGRLWTIVEDVAQVRTTAMTSYLGSRHSKTAIRVFNDIRFGNRFIEAGPTSSRIKLRFGFE